MNFKSWLIENLYLEIYGSFKYVIPSSKKQQFADFYILSNLLGKSNLDSTIGQTGLLGLKKSSAGDRNSEDEIDYMLMEVANKLIPMLKETLLHTLFDGIKGEYDIYLRGKHYTGNRVPEKSEFMDGENFISHAKKVFNSKGWFSGYGGSAWSKICQAWLDLNASRNLKSDIIQIDHIIDIQHNTGSIFEKSPSFKENGNYSWLKEFLDEKANISSPMQLIYQASDAFRPLAMRAIKLKFGHSLDQFNLKRPQQPQTNKPIVPQISDEEKIKSNVNNIQYISNPTENLQMMAIKIDPHVITKINNPTLNVIQFIAKYHKELLNQFVIPEEMQIALIQMDHSLLRFLYNPSPQVRLTAKKMQDQQSSDFSDFMKNF